MTEDEFIALAAIAGWVVDICPLRDGGYTGMLWKDGGKWYVEGGPTVQEVINRLKPNIFHD